MTVKYIESEENHEEDFDYVLELCFKAEALIA